MLWEMSQLYFPLADAVYEGIAGVLLSRSQGLMNQFQQILLREEQVCCINECF